MALEEDFPGLATEIKQLRQFGLKEQEIQSAIADRVKYHQQVGHSGENITAWLHGRPSTIGLETDTGGVPTVLSMGGKTVVDPAFTKRLDTIKESQTMPAGVDPMTGRMRSGWGQKIANVGDVLASNAGTVKSVVQSLYDTGALMDEIHEGYREFQQGLRGLVPPPLRDKSEAPLEDLSGHSGLVMGPLRAALAPVTALIRPTAKAVTSPLPESIQPLAQGAIEAVGTGVMTGGSALGGMKRLMGLKELEANLPTDPTRRKAAEDLINITGEGQQVKGPQLALPAGPQRLALSAPQGRSPEGALYGEAPAGMTVTGRKRPPIQATPVAREIAAPEPPVTEAQRALPPGPESPKALPPGPEAVPSEPIPMGPVPSELPGRPSQPALPAPEARTPEGAIYAESGYAREPGTIPRDPRFPEGPAVLRPGATLVEAAQSSAPKTIPLAKVATPQGPATVVDKGPTDTIVVKTAEDLGVQAASEGQRFTDMQARIAASDKIARDQGITRQQAMKVAESMDRNDLHALAGQSMEEFNKGTGFLTEGKTTKLSAAERKVKVPSVGDLKKLADERGYGLEMRNGKVQLIKNGGQVNELDNMNDARAFLQAKPSIGKQPADMIVSEGESAFDAAVQGKPLNGEQKTNLKRQQTVDNVSQLLPPLVEDRKLPPIGGGSGGLRSGPVWQWIERVANRIGTDALPPTGALRFANPTAGGAVSGSPLIRQAWSKLMWAERAFDTRMRGFGEALKSMKELVPDTARAMGLKEGTILPATENESRFISMANNITKDFAERARDAGLLKEGQEIANYAPHQTDMGALWSTFREQFNGMQGFSDLPAALKSKLTKDQFREFKDVFFKHPDWQTVPKDTMRRIKGDLWNFSDVSSTWENLPEFIQNRLPKEMFVKYFLPRSGKVPYEQDFYKSMQSYIDRVEGSLNFTPWLNEYQPIINSLPGRENDLMRMAGMTERGFLEKLSNNAILRRPTWDDQTMRTIFDRMNTIVGRDLLKSQDINAMSQLVRNGFMRGAIGAAPDSALANMTQISYSWADTGRLAGPMAKFIMRKAEKPPTGLITEFLDVFGRDVTAGQRPIMQKVLAADRKLTEWFLSPMGLAEKWNRGIAWQAGLEEAIAKGYNPSDAMLVGYARASSVVPNLEMTQAQMQAFESVMRTQLGYTPATRAPFFAGVGPLGRMTTMLASFPAHTMQFLQTGVRGGFSDMILKNEPAKFVRYTVLTGGLFGAVAAGHAVGADVSNIFGPQSMLGLVGIPIVKGVMSGYNAIQGNDPWSRETATREWTRFLGTLAIPGFRYGSKVVDIVGNLDRGYAIDKHSRFLYETTEYGELMRLVGANPDKAVDTKKLARTYLELSHQYAFDKQKAIEGLLSGDVAKAQSFSTNWGRQLTAKDIQTTLKQRQTTPESRALSRVPKGVQPFLMQQAGQ